MHNETRRGEDTDRLISFDPMSATDALPRAILPGSLRASWRRHVETPSLPLLVIAACVVQLLIGHYLGGAELSPGNLSRLFAPAPLDTFSDLRIAGQNRILIPLLLVTRAALATAFVVLVAGHRFRFIRLIKVAALNLVSVATLALAITLGIAYVALQSTSGGIALLLAQPILLLLLTRVLSPVVCRVAAGLPARPLLADARLWFYAAVSVWLWMFTWEKATVYPLSFMMVIVQSVLLGAIALRSTQRTSDPTST